MARVPLPVNLTETISREAVRQARADIVRRGWKSASALYPNSQPGKVGISSSVNYLLIQSRGFEPFIMWWVKNRTLPLGCKQGDGPHFRFGNPKAVGEPGYVDIPHKGKVYRQVRWKHPGLKPKRFMETAIKGAIKSNREDIRKTVMNSLKGEQ